MKAFILENISGLIRLIMCLLDKLYWRVENMQYLEDRNEKN